MSSRATDHFRWRLSLAMAAWCYLCADVVLAQDLQGLTLEQAFELIERRGPQILYSSDLVKPWMRVRQTLTATDPRAMLAEILRPYGLAISTGPNGSYIVTRHTVATARLHRSATAQEHVSMTPVANVEEVVVSASQFELIRSPGPPPARLTVTELQSMPDLGDDPLRTLSQLPGAAGDFSAKINVRGGAADETLIRFDHLRLFNPFHLKDFQSVFSSIDPGVISGIDVYTGGFPVAFGDRMSGVIDIAARDAERRAHSEISVSLFNTSILTAQPLAFDRGDWLLSARRSNLDLLLQAFDPRLGEPSYVELYARLRRQLGDALTISGNVLLFNDSISLRDSDQEELAWADYRDTYYWLRLQYHPLPGLAGELLLARTQLDSERIGRSDQPGVSRGALDDQRAFSIDSLQSDWSWRPANAIRVDFGGEFRAERGRYEYRDAVDFDLLFLTAGAQAQPSRARHLYVRPQGRQYGAYASVRLDVLPELTAEGGLRWDRETLSVAGDEQFSPRINLLFAPSERLRLRANWGRFFQAQAINELQISDGVVQFHPAQRADHLIAGIEYLHPDGFDARLEIYRKRYSGLRPRYENLLNSLVLLPELKPDRIQVPPQRATARGAELSIWHMQGGPIGWWFSYAWSTAYDRINGEDVPRSWDQTHSLGAGLRLQGVRWDFSVAGRYHSGWPTTQLALQDAEFPSVVAAGPRNGKRLGDYFALNARIARRFEFSSSDELTVFAELSNLLDRRNECCVDHGIEQDDDEIDLDIDTDAYPGLLPSLGFTWRF